ncbi:hypothetical protein RRG08_064733 [Elysia crispata]|uniref:DNA helicase n=1 Tax=Elysia crispata TaxID=231223 RepID=A0AAE1D893_9GAST|nr:hypothetical protein RRG08_064733 [Elysia crispata]
MDGVQKKPMSKTSLVSIQPADSLTIDHPGAPGFPDSLQMSPATGPKLDSFQIPMLDQLTDRELASSTSAATSTTTMSALEQDNAARVIQEVASRSAHMVESSDQNNLRVGSSDYVPTTITEIAEATEGQGEKPKRKRIREPKEPKPKRVRTPKEPKEPKEPKPRAPRVRKRKVKQDGEMPPAVIDGLTEDIIESSAILTGAPKSLDITPTASAADGETPTSTTNIDGAISGVEMDTSADATGASLQGDDSLKVEESAEEPDGLVEKVKTPRTRKPRAPKTLKLKTPRKRKTPASLILKSRKRRRRDSGSDVELSFGDGDTSVDGGDTNAEKRRSSRNTKRTKYIDDIDLNLSDDDANKLDTESGEGPVTMKKDSEEDQTLIVDKVLGERMRIPDDDSLPEVKDETEEFYVKYKNYSYLHCEWRTLAELERGDRRVLSKIKRFRMKKAQNYFDADDEELFNPDYVEVDRVLDMLVTTNPETQEETTNYLVKWRSLSYEEATWELAQDVDPKKVEMYMRFRESPAEEDRKIFARPRPGQWRQLEESPIYKNSNTLRDYQLEGINWLSFCYYNGQNCILADEMGLGKTIQSITFLNEIYTYGIKGPFLVIVPLSTVGNWQREFETWTDMNVVVYHGTTLSRNMIKEYELFYKDDKGKRIPDIYRFEALITTFEIILTDFELLADIDWRCAIIDEAHRLKNKNCRLLEGLRQFELEHRVLLTGTPLQNNTEELYSLLNFLSPNKFNSSESFIKEFGDLKTEEQVDSLKEILKPMMLRRLKEDVEKNLAPKEETIIEVELTNIQKKYYRAILERNFQFLAKGSSGSIPSLMNTMMELRKCCNHPFLINGAEDNILHEAREKNPGDPNLILHAMVQSSGKMVLMDKLLPRLKSSGHKVLIFSQMIRVLDIIEDYLIQNKYLYERLDGRIRGTVRQEAIDRFSKPDSDRFAFLLCTRAGGLGINLTAADTVVIYDSDWNPQNDLQAQARCHRIGQEKAVKIYRLITRNSYEREMFDRASLKLGLDKAVLQSMGGEKIVNPASQMSKKEIEDLLKKGAYGALMEEDNAGDSFCEEDIDMILQRRTKVIQIESEGKGSTFAKASFSMTENRSDIDINDPNFWQKWAKKADIDTDASKSKSELIVDEPRQRRQTNRYGNDDAAMEISDLESSSGTEDENGVKVPKTRKSRNRGKNADDDTDYANDIPGEKYDRCECFKVEKLLLVYGWGRWPDLLKHAHFKRKLTEDDVLMIARAILAHSLKYYKGDDKIKNFIWDLISTGKEGVLKNHSGLSAPVPRGRKGKKRKENPSFLEDQERPLDFDPEIVLDNGYKKHLHRHSNKVLLRVRLLYYIKQELIGEEAEKVFQNLPHKEINIPEPTAEGELPAPWWDADADKSLIIGVFKHGYEKFNCIRSDPSLIFLSKCGPPDDAALLAEQEDDKDDDEKDDKEKDEDVTKDGIDEDDTSQASFSAPKAAERDGENTASETDAKNSTDDKIEEPNKTDEKDNGKSTEKSYDLEKTDQENSGKEKSEEVMSEGSKTLENEISANTENESNQNSSREKEETDVAGKEESEDCETEKPSEDSDKLPFPDGSLLNVRLRKCITNYQRNHKKRLIKSEQMQRKMERRERTCLNLKEREVKRKELQNSRWTRREEADFYRTVSTFGVEFSRQAGRFRWDRFREQARLDRKPDESLTEYFHAFYFMCQRVCGKLKPGDVPPNKIFVEPITEERASRCLARIDLLNKVRQDILMHPKLEERIKLCQHSYDMPSWWICGQHDKELLIGAARHGVAKTDFNILRDKTLSFHIVLENSLRSLRGQPAPINPYHGQHGIDPMTSTPNPKLDRGNLIVGTPTALLHDIRLSDFKKEEPEVSPVKSVQEEVTSIKEKLKKAVKASMNEAITNNCSEMKEETKAEEAIETVVKKEGCETVDAGEATEKNEEENSSESKEERKEGNEENASEEEPKERTEHECEKREVSEGEEKDNKADEQIEVNNREEKEKEQPIDVKEGDKEKKLEDEESNISHQNSQDNKIGHIDDEVNEQPEKESTKSSQEAQSEQKVMESVSQSTSETTNFTNSLAEEGNCVKNEPKDEISVRSDIKSEADCSELIKNDDCQMPKIKSPKIEENLASNKTELEEGKASPEERQDHKAQSPDSSSLKSEALPDKLPKAEDPPAIIEVGDEDDEENNKPDYVKLKEKIIKTEIERINEERLRREREAKMAAENGMSPYGAGGSKGMFIDDSLMEMEGLEPGEIAPTRYFGPAVEWPKDRVIFHRLEHICYTIEHGEWPFARRPPSQTLFPPGGTPTHLPDSRSQTPVAAFLKSEGANGADSDHSEGLSSTDVTQQIDSMKMAFQKRGPGRRRKYEIDPEKVNRIQQLLNQSAAGALSSDDSQSDSVGPPGQSTSSTGGDRAGRVSSSAPGPSSIVASSLSSTSAAASVGGSPRAALPKSPLVTSASPSTSSGLSHLPQAQTRHLPNPMLNGSMADMDHAQLQRHMLEQGMFIPERKRRGRKRRSEKMAEMAMAEALAKREQARILAMLDPDTRIPMINLEDGSVLTGKDCPRKRHMEAWLQQHPGYMIDNSICLLDPYLADMRASLASRSSRDKESGSSKQSTEKSVPASMEGTAGAHKLSSSHFPGSASSLSASTSPPVSMRTREHHQLMELGEREEEPNPQFVLNTPEIKPETFVRRRGRKPQLDPRTLDIDRLTGNENVAVVERGSGKKITGSKAPPLKHLRQWLDQNPSFDVEHKWGDLVKAKGVLPKSMDNRILRPSGRGRKPREPLHHSQLRHLNSEAQQQQQASHHYPPASLAALSAFPGAAAAAAAMMGNFPKLPMGLPFAGLPGLPGMANPLLGLQGLGIPGMGLPPHLVKAMEEELREREKEMKEQEKLRERESRGGEFSKDHISERRRSSSGSQPEASGEDSRQLSSRQTDSGKADYSSSSTRQAAAAAAAAAAAQAAALAAASSGMKGMSAEQAQQAFAPYLFNPMLYNPLLAAAASQSLQGIQGLGLPTTLAGMLPPGLVLPPHSATSPISSSQPSDSETSISHKSSSSALPSNSSLSSGSSSKHHHHHREDHHRHQEHHQHHHHEKRRKVHRHELQEPIHQHHSSPSSSSSTPTTYHSSSSKSNTTASSYAAEDLSVKVSKSHASQRPSSASSLSPSLQVQDLSVRKHEGSSSQSSSQDHATDLSVRPKLGPTSLDRSPTRDGSQSSPTRSPQSSSASGKVPSSSLKVPHKNKIQSSLKLNKILDSLKDRVLKTDAVGKEKTTEQMDQLDSNDGEDSKKA